MGATGARTPEPGGGPDRRRRRRVVFGRALGATALALGLPAVARAGAPRRASAQAPAEAAPDWEVPGGQFYTQAAPPDAPPDTGYLVADADGVAFWRDYRALGGPGLLGYPVSARYEAGGELYQAFQGGLLRWD